MSNKTTNYNLTKPTADDFYDVEVPNGNMDIIDAELKKLEDGKAPSGHGLGEHTDNHSGVSIKSIMQKGCGFYQVDRVPDADNPADTGAWLTLLQMTRVMRENEETGVQMLFSDLNVNKPRMWFRNMLLGTTSSWVEMIHTGNAVSLLPFLKIANGSITGKGEVFIETSPLVLTFSFQPKVLFFDGMFTVPYGVTYAETFCDRLSDDNAKILLKWEGNNVLIYNNESTKYWLGSNGTTYHYAAIG